MDVAGEATSALRSLGGRQSDPACPNSVDHCADFRGTGSPKEPLPVVPKQNDRTVIALVGRMHCF